MTRTGSFRKLEPINEVDTYRLLAFCSKTPQPFDLIVEGLYNRITGSNSKNKINNWLTELLEQKYVGFIPKYKIREDLCKENLLEESKNSNFYGLYVELLNLMKRGNLLPQDIVSAKESGSFTEYGYPEICIALEEMVGEGLLVPRGKKDGLYNGAQYYTTKEGLEELKRLEKD